MANKAIIVTYKNMKEGGSLRYIITNSSLRQGITAADDLLKIHTKNHEDWELVTACRDHN